MRPFPLTKVACALGVGMTLYLLSVARALPPGFVDMPVANGWNQAVGLTFASDGRMFVWEKAGRVWNVENGARNPQPLIDISEEVGDWRDYGLLGFAVDPDFYNNGFIYLLYIVDYHHARYFGTPQYNPNTNEYFRDTISRLTRYTCDPSTGYRTVLPGSRTILIGPSLTDGIPVLHQSHGIGSLVWGEDGTLLVTNGDAASYDKVDVGGPTAGSSNTALAEGIIRPEEDVGSYRAQLVNCLNGKVLRIDPATGDGVPSNPFYDPLEPRAPRSLVWSLGLRNPFRATLRPGSGNPDPTAGDPGSIYIGDVGWLTWEELNVAKGPGFNFGWPAFEGYTPNNGYQNASPANEDAANPLFGIAGCTQQFFLFRQLIVQDVGPPAMPSWPNPCNPGVQIPANTPRFEHAIPAMDWGHNSPARSWRYAPNGTLQTVTLGTPGAPVVGQPWIGSSSTGGVWYTGTDFPPEYQNTYFQSDFVGQWIRNFIFNASDDPLEVRVFSPEGGAGVGGGPGDESRFGRAVLHRVRRLRSGPGARDQVCE